jgi:putative inorganic carbon (hco3(-)) transporter
LLFALWITITSIFALGPRQTVWGRWELVEKILLMCLVGYALTTTRERVDQLIWAVIIPIGIWGIKGAILGVLHGSTQIHGPDNGFLSDNNAFGLGLLLILPLIFYQWHLTASGRLRFGLVVVGFLVSVAVLLTYSRGALLGVCAMGTVLWLRARAKFVTGLLIAAVVVSTYCFAPSAWFERMGSIEEYKNDPSAMGRIELWKISLRIVELHPLTGGGFEVTKSPVITNGMLLGTDLPRLTAPRATHSIYFDPLSEHGWPGLALFAAILIYSLYNCSWLIRRSRRRADLVWANMLGRTGQAVLVGYATAGAFLSLPYLDEYWCIIFTLDAARRLVAKELAAPANSSIAPFWRSPPKLAQGAVDPTLIRAAASVPYARRGA